MSSDDVEPKGPEGPRAAPSLESANAPDRLVKAVRWASAISLLLLTAFAAVYLVDRYVATGDRSPLDVNIEDLEEAVRSDPSNPDARLALAEVYIADRRFDEALDQAGAVLDEYPGNQRALLVLGIAHEASDQPDAAIAVLEIFVDLRKDSPMAQSDMALEAAYFYLGRSYLAAGRSQEAAEALDSAVAINPGDADALHQAGLAYLALGDAERALEVLETATAFVPDFAEVYEAMSIAYASVGDSDRVRYAEAMQLYSAGQSEAALPELLTVAAALPEFAPVHLGLALAYEKLGEVESGLAAAERALELRPDYLAARQTLGRLLQHQEGNT